MADTWCSVCAGSHERGFDCVTPDKTTSAIDLVERLRWWADDGHPHGLLHREAADTITRLQAALERIAAAKAIFAWDHGPSVCYAAETKGVAREALRSSVGGE